MEGPAAANLCFSFSPISFRQKSCVPNARKPLHWVPSIWRDLRWVIGRVGMRSGKTEKLIGSTNPNVIQPISQNCERDGTKQSKVRNPGNRIDPPLIRLNVSSSLKNSVIHLSLPTVQTDLTISVNKRIHTQRRMMPSRSRFLDIR
jgi:hypothetical protein